MSSETRASGCFVMQHLCKQIVSGESLMTVRRCTGPESTENVSLAVSYNFLSGSRT